MIQISKSKRTGRYHVGIFASNHLLLASTGTSGLASRKSVFKNIKAMIRTFRVEAMQVQDNTIANVPVMLKVWRTANTTHSNSKPVKAWKV